MHFEVADFVSYSQRIIILSKPRLSESLILKSEDALLLRHRLHDLTQKQQNNSARLSLPSVAPLTRTEARTA